MIACFIGHRKISVDDTFLSELKNCIEKLIAYQNFDTFLFGSHSQFDDICLKTVTKLKINYPHIKRVYVRANYPKITEQYQGYLLTLYDETFIAKRAINAGKAAYIKRNQEMIDRSDLCIFYYDKNYVPYKMTTSISRNASFKTFDTNSGTKRAYEYANSKNKQLLNVFPTVRTQTEN